MLCRFAVALVLACAPAPACSREAEPGVPVLPPIDRIQVEKARRTMTLYAQGRVAHVITGIQLGDAPVGHKQFRGDERTPEGRYAIDFFNPDSAFHLSMRISYPRPQDRADAEAQGRNPGGDIFIHGQPNALPFGRMTGDWTDGCIALSNAEMDALWNAVTDDVAVDILP